MTEPKLLNTGVVDAWRSFEAGPSVVVYPCALSRVATPAQPLLPEAVSGGGLALSTHFTGRFTDGIITKSKATF